LYTQRVREVVDLVRQAPIAVSQGAEQSVQRPLVFRRRQLTISGQPESFVADVRPRDEVIQRQVKRHLRGVENVDSRALLASGSKSANRVRQHLDIHLKANRSDGTMLFGAQQAAVTPNFQVPQRVLEAPAQLVQALH